jgi:sec-independent protein translocase protein TatB
MDIGMSELLVIGIVALIVIGPKDLPEMFRQLGRFTAKLRAMSREFSRAMEQAAAESGMKDVAKDLQAVANPKSTGLNAVKDAVDKFERWDPVKNAAKPTQPMTSSTLVPPPMPPAMPPVVKPPVLEPEVPAVPANVGPNTAALYEKKAARAAIVKETAAKLKALDEAPMAPADAAPAAKPKAPRKKKAQPE